VSISTLKRTFTEICNGREFSPKWPSCIEAVVQTLDGISSILLILESGIDISDKMVANVIADMHFLDLAVFRQLNKEILIDVVKVLLDLWFGEGAVGVVGGVVVDVGDEDSLREVGLDVFP
jgi:hypothetical protein